MYLWVLEGTEASPLARSKEAMEKVFHVLMYFTMIALLLICVVDTSRILEVGGWRSNMGDIGDIVHDDH